MTSFDTGAGFDVMQVATWFARKGDPPDTPALDGLPASLGRAKAEIARQRPDVSSSVRLLSRGSDRPAGLALMSAVVALGLR